MIEIGWQVKGYRAKLSIWQPLNLRNGHLYKPHQYLKNKPAGKHMLAAALHCCVFAH